MNRVYDFLINTIKLNNDDTVVVGVSAGPDSMALLYILNDLRKKYNFKIIVAHVNHNVRIESKEEEKFIRNYALEHDDVFESMMIEKYGEDNFHNEARNIRYHFYEDLISKYHANYLMTGHHGDDLIETILMRIVRGSTLKGYSGFDTIADKGLYKIVRPLIFMTKAQLLEFDKTRKIEYRVDQSNSKDKYTRNRYRKSILPFLKEEDALVHEKFYKFSNVLRDYNLYIDKEMHREFVKVYKDGMLDISNFLKLDHLIEERIIDYLLENIYHDDLFMINDKHVELIFELINSDKASSSFDLPANYMVVKSYNYLYFKKVIDEITNYDIILSDCVTLPNGMVIKRLDECKENGNDILRINSSSVKMPLHVRTRLYGDRMKIMNLNGSKKIKDIFIDAKIPLSKRDKWPIVVDSANEVVWIPKLKKSQFNVSKNENCDIILKCY